MANRVQQEVERASRGGPPASPSSLALRRTEFWQPHCQAKKTNARIAAAPSNRTKAVPLSRRAMVQPLINK